MSESMVLIFVQGVLYTTFKLNAEVQMERIRQLRTKRGLSQAKLAVMADMDPATLNRLERGTGNPNLKTLERVADALGVEVADFFPKAPGRSSLEPSLLNGLEEERRPAILARGVADAVDKWDATVSNPDASPYEISAAVDAALDLGGALAGQLGEPSTLGYSPERWEGIRLAARLLEISKGGNERILDSGPEEQVNRRREQVRELTRRISA
jgi:transcriptional regulator with XRE-family HTH domain